MSEEEAKNERIKKGLAALSLEKKTGEEEIQQKRKNFLAEMRDALITGSEVPEGEPKTKKIKKQKKGSENL